MKAMCINTTIKELILADNKFGDENLLMSEICKVLEENQTLTQLNLENNEIRQEGAQKMMEVVKETKRTKIALTSRFEEEFCNEFNATMKAVKGKKKKKRKKKKK